MSTKDATNANDDDDMKIDPARAKSLAAAFNAISERVTKVSAGRNVSNPLYISARVRHGRSVVSAPTYESPLLRTSKMVTLLMGTRWLLIQRNIGQISSCLEIEARF